MTQAITTDKEFTFTTYEQFIYKRTYARWMEGLDRRETFDETVERYKKFFISRVPKKHQKEYNAAIAHIKSIDVMPSMRAFFTAGPALERDNISGYNCCACAIDTVKSFAELLYILMNGTGVGFSVERQIVCKLPVVPKTFEKSDKVIVFKDSKKGWAEGFYAYMRSLYAGEIPTYDLSKIRAKGERLKTFGGKACLTGDTILYKDRKKSKECNEITIKDLYDMENSQGKWKHKSNHFKDVKLRSLDESTGKFYRNNVITVIDNGIAPVYEITTSKGYKIKATMNHRFMNETGDYSILEEFKIGDLIAVNGSKEIKTGVCCDCGTDISRRAIRCKECHDLSQIKNNANETTARRRKENLDFRVSKKDSCCEKCECIVTDKRFEVHHIDENPKNNIHGNLQWLCPKCHQAHHSKKRSFGDAYKHKYVSYDNILSIKYVGDEQVFDLQMEAPDHNFVANGFVSHNSGPEPLDLLLKYTKKLIMGAAGRKLKSIECHDLACYICNAVVVGGVDA